MNRTSFLVVALVLFSRLLTACSAAAAPTHDREFWREITKNHYAIPPGQSAPELAKELARLLGSVDPELRDDLAYTILSVWIARPAALSAADLLPFLEAWQANLRSGIGESKNDSVFLRSFSALCLAAIAERDLKTPFLGEARFRALLEETLRYFRDEKDLRGFDPDKGWIHATAHTADLLAALANNPLLKTTDQPRLLDAISLRIQSSSDVFTYGEQDRLAALIATIVLRKDFDPAGFRTWLSALNEGDRKVWNTSPPNLALLHGYENDSYLLQALAARLGANPASAATADVLRQLAEILRRR